MRFFSTSAILTTIIFAVLIPSIAFADDSKPPLSHRLPLESIPDTGTSAKSFLPPEWRVERSISGDITGDGIEDLVIQAIHADGNSRGLVIIASTGGGKFEKIGAAANILRCKQCFGDPAKPREGIAEIEIAGGVVSINERSGFESHSAVIRRLAWIKESRELVLIGDEIATEHPEPPGADSTAWVQATTVTKNYARGESLVTESVVRPGADEPVNRFRKETIPKSAQPLSEVDQTP